MSPTLDYFSVPPVIGEDTQPPVINTCPDSINNVIPIGITSIAITWTEPTATDNSGISPTVTQSHQPGDSFPVGVTQVTYTFTDMAGNEATCFFTVTNGNFHVAFFHLR